MKTRDKATHIGQIFLELTNVCNMDCVFCANSRMMRRKQFMEFSLAKKLIDEIADKGIAKRIAFFLMGEPLLHPQVFEILKYAAERKLQVTLNTNGALLNQENIGQLLEIALETILVSLQISTPEDFSLKRPHANLSFQKYIGGIKQLLERKSQQNSRTNLTILFMDPRFNLAQFFLNGLNTLKIDFDKNKLSLLSFDLAKTVGDNIRSKNRLSLKAEQISAEFKRFVLGNYKKRISDNIDFVYGGIHNWGDSIFGKPIMQAAFGSCNALREQFAVLSNGDYSLCCKDYNGELVIGNAYRQNILEILNSPKAKRIKSNFRHCRLSFRRCQLCRGGINIFDVMTKEIFSSVVYNAPIVLRFFRALVLR